MVPHYSWSPAALGLLSVLVAGCDNDPVGAFATGSSLAVVPSQAQMVAGSSIQVAAQVLDAKGRILPFAQVLWSSSNAVVATVFPDDEVTGRAYVQSVSVGTATITATHANLTAAATVSVIPDSLGFLASFDITESTMTVRVGTAQPLNYTAFNRRGMPTFTSVSWSSSDLAVAEVFCCYSAYGRSAGRAWIVGRAAGGLRDSVDVTVVP